MSAQTTAAQAIAGIDLTGKRAIVTGGASGIGVETARALAGAGAEVTLAVRDTVAGERVATDVGAVAVEYLDLCKPESVEAFTQRWTGPLDILVNNAGVMALPELERTPEGWEMQFAVNHLGHFALTVGLHEALAQANGARVVAVSSTAHQRSPVVFDDINFRFRPYDSMLAYGQSKTANVLFAVGATQRWADEGICVNALHPGAIFDTNLARHMDPEFRASLKSTYTYKTIEQGAATSVYVATAPELEGIGGRYYGDTEESEVISERGAPGSTGVAPYALDHDNADRLWELSLAATQHRSQV